MKKIKIISLLAALLLSATGYGQIKIESGGQTKIGGGAFTTDYSLWITGGFNSGPSKAARFDLGIIPNYIYFKENSIGDQKLVIHSERGLNLKAKHGTFMQYDPTDWSDASTLRISCPIVSHLGHSFYVNGSLLANNIYYYNLTQYSDEKFKSEITNLSDNSLSQLSKLRAVKYKLDFTKAPLFGREDMIFGEGEDIAKSMTIPSDTSTHFGFVAQELQMVFPQLVKTDKEGNLSVDYVGLIPVIVDAMKEQNAVIEAQSKKIAELAGDAGANVLLPGSSQARSLAVQEQNEAIAADAAVNAFLYQNEPNPFSQSTQIRYFLPAGAVGSLTIEAAELAPGMYIYSLIADGKEVDSKRMIVTE